MKENADDRLQADDLVGHHMEHSEIVLYENPFWKLGETHLLSQDETAIGTMLLGMRNYLKTREEVYPLKEALQDAYVRILMSEVLEMSKMPEMCEVLEKSDAGAGKQMAVVTSERQPWC